jgi:hypothetical protein
MYSDKSRPFNDLLGKVFTSIEVEDDMITFNTTDGSQYLMFHEQDCCESVTIDDINGNLDDIIGSPILVADETSDHDDNLPYSYSCTWTFYKLATEKGWVDIKWYGESNGYYSEEVGLYKIR